MTHRFGEFILDPVWPCSDDENNPHFVNFDDFDEEDVCKINQIHDNRELKIQYLENQQFLSEKSEQQYIKAQEISQSESQYIASSSDMSSDTSNIKKKIQVKLQSQPFQPPTIKQKQHYNPKIRQTLRNPQKTCQVRNKNQFQRGKYNILSQDLKKQIVQQSKTMTMVQVAKKYHVSVNNICRWRKRCDRRTGAGRKVTDMDMENSLLEWLMVQTNPIARKEVQTMAKKMSKLQGFKASKGWFQRFYKRNKIHYNTNIEILTHNDYRQRFAKTKEQCSKLQNTNEEQSCHTKKEEY